MGQTNSAELFHSNSSALINVIPENVWREQVKLKNVQVNTTPQQFTMTLDENGQLQNYDIFQAYRNNNLQQQQQQPNDLNNSNGEEFNKMEGLQKVNHQRSNSSSSVGNNSYLNNNHHHHVMVGYNNNVNIINNNNNMNNNRNHPRYYHSRTNSDQSNRSNHSNHSNHSNNENNFVHMSNFNKHLSSSMTPTAIQQPNQINNLSYNHNYLQQHLLKNSESSLNNGNALPNKLNYHNGQFTNDSVYNVNRKDDNTYLQQQQQQQLFNNNNSIIKKKRIIIPKNSPSVVISNPFNNNNTTKDNNNNNSSSVSGSNNNNSSQPSPINNNTNNNNTIENQEVNSSVSYYQPSTIKQINNNIENKEEIGEALKQQLLLGGINNNAAMTLIENTEAAESNGNLSGSPGSTSSNSSSNASATGTGATTTTTGGSGRQVIIIEFGNQTTKVGFSGEDRPRVVIPSCYTLEAQNTIKFGGNISFQQTETKWFFKNGNFTFGRNDLKVKEIFKAFIKYISILLDENFKGKTIMLGLPYFFDENKEQLAILCDCFFHSTIHVKSIFLCGTPLFSFLCAASNHVTENRFVALSVVIGYGLVQCVPIVGGLPFLTYGCKTTIGGELQNSYLLQLVKQEAAKEGITIDEKKLTYQQIEQEKRENCNLLKSFRWAKKKVNQDCKAKFFKKTMDGVEGKVDQVLDHRYLTNELLFHPELFIEKPEVKDIEKNEQVMGVAELIEHCIKRCPKEYQELLYNNIIISGGPSQTRNFVTRLKGELGKKANIYLNDLSILKPTPTFDFSAWYGMSFLSNVVDVNSHELDNLHCRILIEEANLKLYPLETVLLTKRIC
ncbi:hypothetical protein ABK040_000192 [Willaertia magna]